MENHARVALGKRLGMESPWPGGTAGNPGWDPAVPGSGGYGYGAAVLMDKVFVDSSRVGGHYTKAIMIASALAGKDRS